MNPGLSNSRAEAAWVLCSNCLSLLSDGQDSSCHIPGTCARLGPFREALLSTDPISSAGNGGGYQYLLPAWSRGQALVPVGAQDPAACEEVRQPPPVRKLQALCQLKTVLCKSSALRSGRKSHGQLDMPLSDAGISATPMAVQCELARSQRQGAHSLTM